MQLPLVGATEGALPLRVADIYQQFSSPAEGTVRNIIKLSVWPWLQARASCSQLLMGLESVLGWYRDRAGSRWMPFASNSF